MLRRAGRRWYRSMGWVLILTFIITLAAGIYMHFYEPERCVAEYTLCAVPEPEGQKPAPLSMWMLLRDINRLLDEDSFRQQIVAQTPSDGKTFVSARGSAADHMVVIRAAGIDEAITTQMANAVGDQLAAEGAEMLGAASVSTVQRAQLLPRPGRYHDLWRLLWTMLISFAVLSLLAVLFGSRREPVGWYAPPKELEVPVVGQVAECERSCSACVKELKKANRRQKKAKEGEADNRNSECRLSAHVDRLVREGIDETALFLRSRAGLKCCSIAVTGVRAEDEATAAAVLLAETLADEGYAVLMLEMDGDRPDLRDYLGVTGQVDVIDCLTDGSKLPQAILTTNTPNLHMIDCCHSGETVRKAAASARCRSFVRDALAIYDYVILNAPPASFGNCAAAVGSAVDQTLLVAQDQRYTAKELNSVAAALRQRSADLCGVLFTGAKKRRLRAVYQEDGRAYRRSGKDAAAV